MSINNGILWTELVRLVSWTSFHHNVIIIIIIIFVFPCANLCVVLHKCMNMYTDYTPPNHPPKKKSWYKNATHRNRNYYAN